MFDRNAPVLIDSVPLEGAGQQLDTYNLLAMGTQQCLREIAKLQDEKIDAVAERLGLSVYIARSVKGGGSREKSRRTCDNVLWTHYGVLLALRGEATVQRLSYCEGTLEIMAPSRTREQLKSRIGRLVEVYLLDHDIDFEAVGSGR